MWILLTRDDDDLLCHFISIRGAPETEAMENW